MPFTKGHKTNVGKPCSEETRRIISEKVRKPKVGLVCNFCSKAFDVIPSLRWVKFCSKECRFDNQRGKPSWNAGLKGWREGEKHPWMPRGENHWSWTGGSRYSLEYVHQDGELQHRTVIRNTINRELLSRDVVHHWDKNGKNNKRENLALFRTQSAHKRLHHFADRHGLDIKDLWFPQPWLERANAENI